MKKLNFIAIIAIMILGLITKLNAQTVIGGLPNDAYYVGTSDPNVSLLVIPESSWSLSTWNYGKDYDFNYIDGYNITVVAANTAAGSWLYDGTIAPYGKSGSKLLFTDVSITYFTETGKSYTVKVPNGTYN